MKDEGHRSESIDRSEARSKWAAERSPGVVNEPFLIGNGFREEPWSSPSARDGTPAVGPLHPLAALLGIDLGKERLPLPGQLLFHVVDAADQSLEQLLVQVERRPEFLARPDGEGDPLPSQGSQVPFDVMDVLHDRLQSGQAFGNFRVAGSGLTRKRFDDLQCLPVGGFDPPQFRGETLFNLISG